MEHFGVEPDLITVAKSIAVGLPLSGVLGRAEIMDAPRPGGVGGTYVGNPVAQAAALAVLDVIDDEGLVERSAAIGETIRARMLAWQERWPAIGDVRGLGSMLAIEFVADPATKEPAPRARARASCRRRSSAACCCSRAASTATASACSSRSSSPTRSSTRRSASGKRRSRRRSISEALRAGKERPLLVGDVLADRYELEELAGSGGMSTVFRAQRPRARAHASR